MVIVVVSIVPLSLNTFLNRNQWSSLKIAFWVQSAVDIIENRTYLDSHDDLGRQSTNADLWSRVKMVYSKPGCRRSTGCKCCRRDSGVLSVTEETLTHSEENKPCGHFINHVNTPCTRTRRLHRGSAQQPGDRPRQVGPPLPPPPLQQKILLHICSRQLELRPPNAEANTGNKS